MVMDWEKARIEYVTNPKVSYQTIADRYGVSRTQVANRSRDEGWRQLRDDYLKSVCTKTLDVLAEQAADREVKIVSVADKLLSKLDQAVDGCNPVDLLGNPKLARALTGAVLDLRTIFDIRSRADKDEQEARIAKLRKEAQKEEHRDNTIEVVFTGSEEAWSE